MQATFKLFFLAGILFTSFGSVISQEDPVAVEVELRKKLVMEYFDLAIDVGSDTRRGISNMVDVYLQGTIRVGNQLAGRPDVLRSVNIDLSKNHLQMLGNYLSNGELADYIASVLQDADETDQSKRCNICDHPKKINYEYCVFCGKSYP